MNNYNEENKIDKLDNLINQLNDDKKPPYEDFEDEEMAQLLETVRAVKRSKSNYLQGEQIEKTAEGTSSNRADIRKIFNSKRFISIASILLIFAIATSILPFWGNNHVVQAMVEAYEKLNSYSGVIEIKSTEGNKVEQIQTITVQYKKPNKYIAVHQLGDTAYTQISDGDRLYTIDEDSVVIDYSNPEKELWRYHIGQRIEDIVNADTVEKVGNETLNGRETTIYRYGDAESTQHKVWVDDKTKLPLKTELNFGDSQLINYFKEIEINPKLSEEAFSYTPSASQRVVELNKKVDLEEVKDFWTIDPSFVDKTVSILQKEGLGLEEVIKLDTEQGDEFLIKFKDNQLESYIDVYLVKDSDVDRIYYDTSDVALFKEGWTELKQDALNVNKVYIGKSNLIRWIRDKSWGMTMVSNLELQDMITLLEEIADQEMKGLTRKQLEQYR